MSVPAQTDVVVVGAGVAGALVADQLSAAGVRVVVLEAGPEPASHETAAEKFVRTAIKNEAAPFVMSEAAPFPDAEDIGAYLVQDGPDTYTTTYLRAVGGTTWHWVGTCPRHVPNDLQLHTKYGVGVDWPFTYDELEPWYGRADQELGVAGPSDDDQGSPRSTPFPMEEVPLSFLDKRVRDAAASLGLPVVATPAARNTEGFNDRPRCEGRSNCTPICPIGAKYDAMVHVDRIRERGVLVEPNAVVHDVLVTDGMATGVVFRRPDGTDETLRARVVVLAAHGIETPKIMLMSNGGQGVGNSSDQVGRNLMEHPGLTGLALAASPVFGERGPVSTSTIEATKDTPDRSFRGAFRIGIGNDGWRGLADPTVESASFIRPREGGSALARRWSDHVSRQLRFTAFVEMLPKDFNRVTPAFDQLDAIGIPRPRIHWDVTSDPYVQGAFDAGRKVITSLMDALGASNRIFAAGTTGHHPMGTTRMGNDPKTSVVDQFGRSHDVPNLWVVGGSVQPSVGTSNPTLTIAALSLRTADGLLRSMRSMPNVA